MGNAWFKFPRLNGGCCSSLNYAGIETLKSDPWGKLAGECAQNSLDAQAGDDPAKLFFKFHEMDKTDKTALSNKIDAFIKSN